MFLAKIFKLLIIIILLIFILNIIAFIFFYAFFNLVTTDNFINTGFRKQFLAQPLARKLFKLHQVGDARYDYSTADHLPALEIIVYKHPGENLDPQTLPTVIAEIKKVIQKPQGITTTEYILDQTPPPIMTDQDLDNLIRSYPLDQHPGSTAILQIFVLKQYSTVPTFAGLVTNDHSLFIFKDIIKDLADDQTGERNLEISTILHEFGHLLGADHVDQNDCLMSEKVENLERGLPSTAIPTTYCHFDLRAIQSALTQ